ncbi:MAG: ATP-binding cassette domain-containing protein, partial [Saprospiraceae bacterium]
STGSGKSTIINLLNRFYDIRSGHIRINGVDIRDYELEDLRKRLAIVLQDVFLFSGTVSENISLRNKSISVDRIVEASKTIGAHPFIIAMPGGYDFVVSERGGNLSMGQRQLISFVRALVYDPEILILDEATSSIDTETEGIIQYAIEKLIDKRTSIIIAHRLSTIRHADRILVLEKGIVVEYGSHDELLKVKNGRYKKLYDMQFRVGATVG